MCLTLHQHKHGYPSTSASVSTEALAMLPSLRATKDCAMLWCRGWIEGIRMCDPIIIAYGKGQLPGFPAEKQVP